MHLTTLTSHFWLESAAFECGTFTLDMDNSAIDCFQVRSPTAPTVCSVVPGVQVLSSQRSVCLDAVLGARMIKMHKTAVCLKM